MTANDRPVVNVGAAQTYNDTVYHGISGVSVSDTLDGVTVTAVVSATSGTLRVTAGSGTNVTGNGSTTLTISGTRAVVNGMLSTLQYASTAPASGTDTITVSYNDNGTTLLTGAKSATATIAVNLVGNVAPTVDTATPQVVQDTNAHSLTGFTITDSTGGGASYTATISDTTGNLTVTAGTGAAGISGSGTNTVTVTGSVANINAALATISYRASATATGLDTVTVQVNDNGAAANLIGGSKTGTGSMGVTLIGNDTPVLTMPGGQTITTNIANAISGTSFVDTLTGGTVTATVTAQQGTLSATGANGNGTGTLTINAASVGALNSALGTLSYTSTATTTGSDTISVTVNDGYSSGIGGAKSDTETIAIKLIGAASPVITVPATQDIRDTLVHNLTGVQVNVDDADPATAPAVQVTISTGVGTVAVSGNGGATVLGGGTGAMTLSGTLTQVNTALGNLTYAAASDGNGGALADVVTITVTNDGNATGIGGPKSASNTIAITLINNDQPTVSAPAKVTLDDTLVHTISGISVADTLSGTSFSATVSDQSGTLSFSGMPTITDGGSISTVANGDTSVTINASTLADLNAMLANLQYKTGSSITTTGRDVITVSVNDTGSTSNLILGDLSRTSTIAVDLVGNIRPTVTVPGVQTITTNVANTIAGVSLADGYNGGTYTATISANHGIVIVGWGSGAGIVSGSGTATATITGTRDDINAALATTAYITSLTASGNDSITVAVNDGRTAAIGGAMANTRSIEVNVLGNTTPVVTVGAGQSFQDINLHALSGISFSDSDVAASVTAKVSALQGTLDVTNGGASATIQGNDTGTVTVSGSVADVNAALATVQYATSRTTSGDDVVTVKLDDNATTLVGGDKINSNTVTIHLSGNDTPTVTVAGAQSFTDGDIHSITGISVADNLGGASYTATISDNSGHLAINQGGGAAAITGSGTNSVVVTGSLAAINNALATVQYSATTSGSDVITVAVDDNGATAAMVGGDKTGTRVIAVSLIGNDTPTVLAPSTRTFVDTNAHPIGGLSVFDLTSGSTLTATVTAQHGNLTFSGSGITGNGSGSVTITAANVGALNTVLGTLSYATTAASSVSDTIGISVNDHGATSNLLGGTKIGSGTIAIIPTPVITGPLAGGTVSSGTPTVSGTAEPGSTVTVYDGGTVVGTTTTDSSGHWSVTTSPLGSGSNTLTTTETNGRGVTSAPSGGTQITVAGAPLPTPTTPTTSVLTGTNVPLQGSGGIPGATVQVMDNGTMIGTATIDGAGHWSFTSPLPVGSDAITVRQVDSNGDVGPVSAPLPITAYTVTAPVISGPADGGTVGTFTPSVNGTAQPGTEVKVYDGTTLVGTATADNVGHWSVTTPQLTDGLHSLSATATNSHNVTSLVSGATAITVAGDPLPTPTTLTTSVLTGANVPLQGSGGIPGATVQVMDNGTVIGSATVDGSGHWSFTSPLPVGSDAITVRQVDSNGDVGPVSAPLAITAYTVTAPVITGPAGGGTVGSFTPNVSGTAQPGGIVKVYDGTTLIGSATADNSGHWSLTTTTLADGLHSLSVTATNPQNVTSLVSGATVITVHGDQPGAPIVSGGATQSSNSVPLSGDGAIPGATITVMDGTTVIGQSVVDGSGHWTSTVTLAEGSHQITTRQTDPNGDVGPISAPTTLNVFLPKPAPPPPPPAPVVVAPPPAPAAVEAPVALVTSIRAAVADNAAFTQGGQGNVFTPVVAAATGGGGFQVALSAPPVNAISDGGLFVQKGIPTVVAETNVISFAVPVDAFGHTSAEAGIQLAAKLTSGQPLPSWVTFDSVHGTFVGEAPAGFTGSLSVVVVARDNGGHEVATTFKIQVGGGGGTVKDGHPATKPAPQGPPPAGRSGDATPLRDGKLVKFGDARPVGKPSFTQQLKMAARNAAIRFG